MHMIFFNKAVKQLTVLLEYITLCCRISKDLKSMLQLLSINQQIKCKFITKIIMTTEVYTLSVIGEQCGIV